MYSTVTKAAASSGGSLAKARVTQFTTAASGTGRGYLQQVSSSTPTATSARQSLLADVDNDGDLDLVSTSLTATYEGLVSIQLNGGNATGSNTGTFSNGSTLSTANNVTGLTAGDVDADGDLDLLLISGTTTGVLQVLLNGGDTSGSATGTFSNGSTLRVNSGRSPTLGDIDGDGDLDLLLIANNGDGIVSYLNNGAGANLFGSPATLAVSGATTLALADVDGDGDLDLLATTDYGKLSIYLNGGDANGSNTGRFSGSSSVTVGTAPDGLAVGDIDGDGDLDAVTCSYYNTLISVCLNGGNATGSNTGTFSNNAGVNVGNLYNTAVSLADMDGDGDLDLLTTGTGPNTVVNVFLNGGNATGSNTGVFSNNIGINLAGGSASLVTGDLDGDGDLDVATSANLCLNQPTRILATQSSLPAATASFTITPTVVADAAPQYTYTGPALLAGATLTTYSATGQQVGEQVAVTGNTGRLLTAGLASGWYVVRLHTTKGSYTARFYQP